MRNSRLFFAALSIILLGAGCARSTPAQAPTASRAMPASDEGAIVGERSIAKVESELGFDLPSDAQLVGVVENNQQYQATIKTAMTNEEASGFVGSAIEGAGYTLFGNWVQNNNPYQGTVSSATYKKNGKAMSVFLREKDGVTQMEFNQEQ